MENKGQNKKCWTKKPNVEREERERALPSEFQNKEPKPCSEKEEESGNDHGDFQKFLHRLQNQIVQGVGGERKKCS